ncbi:MAG: ATP-binding protein [Pseudomonadota bacterium]
MPTKEPAESINHYEQVLKYWSVIETLNPQGVPKGSAMDDHARSYVIKDEKDQLPWHPEHKHQAIVVTERNKWVYTLYAGDSLLEDSFATIMKTFKSRAKSYAGVSKEVFSLFSFAVDHFGRLQSDSVIVSSYAWALGVIESYESESYARLDGFHDAEEAIARELKDFLSTTFSSSNLVAPDTNSQRRQAPEIVEPVTMAQLFALYDFMCDKLSLPRFKEERTLTVKAQLLSEESGYPESSGILNSFLLDDLTRLQEEAAAHNLSEAAKQYLSDEIDYDARVDIRQTSSAFMDVFAPVNYPRGCWPNKGGHPLVFSQQFAVNSFFKERTTEDGLFSVNGPPGTGKTTLLRDVIANIIVERACCLAEFKAPGDAFSRTIVKKSDGKESLVYRLEKSLHGFEIVVASSNNAAVENITLEIPGIDAVDSSILGEADYFRPWAERLLNEKAWGLIAGRLGNKYNRDAFIKNFWLDVVVQEDSYVNLSKLIAEKQDDGKGFEGYLRAHSQTSLTPTLDDETGTDGQTTNQLKAWNDAVAAFNAALAKESQLRQISQDVYTIYKDMIPLKRELAAIERAMTSVTDQQTATGLKDKLEEIRNAIRVHEKKIPADFDKSIVPDFLKQSHPHIETQECSSPWMDAGWYQARVNVFLAALNVHRTFVLANACVFRMNLKQFMFMLAGDGSLGDEAKHLWGTLFLLIPVISTTFASFARLFADMDKESLGWVLIDEAGQALPQAAIGSLWRAKRALLVGDPLQLEPVIILDEKIQTTMASFAHIAKKWVPGFNSAQELADRVGRLGTDVDDTWVGVPLRVHRRCDSLMFQISNAMAYDNMMVFGTPKRPELTLPASQWFHVDSSYSKGNWIEEEGHILETLLTSLEKAGVDMKDVFLISPFTDVIYNTRGLKKRYGIKSGTIHSVQGKENQIVILVLGGRPQVLGARLWATRRPNLLNVAVTRAKRRLYVIGNKRLWSQLPNARVIARVLGQGDGLSVELVSP